MILGLFLLLFNAGHMLSLQPPDVDCITIDVVYVFCTWGGHGTPEVNYTFLSWFDKNPQPNKCDTYISENGTNTGCKQPYDDLKIKRFNTFHTKLKYGNVSFLNEHPDLKSKVKLNPPTNVTFEIGSESNLWFYWNHSFADCAECQVRYRTNNNNWEVSTLGYRKHNYCINLPSRTSRYELQVRSTVGELCAKSIYWSDWSQPVFWGPVSKNHNPSRPDSLLLSLLGAITPFVLLVMVTTVYRERIKVILLPVFPNPSEKFKFNEFLIHDNVEEWLHISKGLKEGLKPNFNEHICSVREYNLGPDSASECSDSSSSSVATDQTNCSISMESNESDCLSLSCSSSASTLPFSSEEGQNTV
ncbi:cytokine receptor common subunit gamma-like [Lampris incognitus]|uniref:cytokine receptor common subunit gamma-like n=1 Tax=Lampris incognitus TaxID=2546036 RepID=UPI0024B5E553|nr:cytokine receptor common subunit gamma-like [Lampris incognitus]